MRSFLLTFIVLLFTQTLAACTVYNSPLSSTPTPPTLTVKVAIIGDQSLGDHAVAVLKLIKQEGADFVIHAGDFDYHNDPTAWIEQIDSVLGSDFPYFAAVGNHDLARWPDYQQLLVSRLNHTPGADCTGDYGNDSWCTYQGIGFLLSGVGTTEGDHFHFASLHLPLGSHPPTICVWHKNQTAMQVGGKGDEVGWDMYELCRERGAIIVSGHEHSYERTKTLINMTNQTINPDYPDPNHLLVTPGSTFVVVSGIAGHSIRPQLRCLPTEYPYGCHHEWAKIYTSSQTDDAQYGALFLDLNSTQSSGYFKTTSGETIDSFTISQ